MQNPTSARLLALGGLLVSPFLSVPAAQSQFEELGPERYVPVALANTTDAVALDVEGDGDLDVVTAVSGAQNLLFLNDGQGRFSNGTAEGLPADSATSQSVVAGDVDGDDHPDLVFGDFVGLLLYVNDGSGAFVDATSNLPVTSVGVGGLALVDVNGDGHLDVVLGGTSPSPQATLLLNDGTGVFTDATAGRMPVETDFNAAVAVGDVDEDGSPDLFLANAGQDRLYVNDGAGFFSDVSATNLPVENLQAISAALVDLDGDTHLDVFLGHFDQPKAVWLNDGSGAFAPGGSLPVNTAHAQGLALTDVDQDGDADVLLGQAASFTETSSRNLLWLNDGSASFTDVSAAQLPEDDVFTRAVLLEDFDGSGSPDAWVANLGQDRLYLSDGLGLFVDTPAFRIQWSRDEPAALAVLDADLDGDADLVVGIGHPFLGEFGLRSTLHRNDGTGRFEAAPFTHVPTNVLALAAGDVDGDTDPDLVLGTAALVLFPNGKNPQSNRLLLNDGAGGFVDTPGLLPGDTDDTYGLALGDVDGNGSLDLVTGNLGQENRLYTNDGAGTFTDVTVPQYLNDPRDTQAVVLGDADGDGAPELFVANALQQNRMYANDGFGVFSDVTVARMPVAMEDTRALALGDLDGDDDLDLVLGDPVGAGLYLNDGAGFYTNAPERIPPGGAEGYALALGDVDEDGDLDLVLGTSFFGAGASNVLYVNDGNATFSAATQRLAGDPERTRAVALADLDGDRDLDLVVANVVAAGEMPFASEIRTNLHRQLRAPLLALLGRDYELEVHAEPGYGTTLMAAKVFLSFGLLPGPLHVSPLVGSLYIAPPFVSPPAFVIPLAQGSAVLSFVVPAEPAFLGKTLFSQAVLAGSGTSFELTGYARDTVHF